MLSLIFVDSPFFFLNPKLSSKSAPLSFLHLENMVYRHQQLQKLIARVTEAYDNFAFHRVFTLIYNFCTVEMSSLYMDVLKDRMYCDAADSMGRRSGQTAMYKILDALVRMLAPVLAHTAEEAWAAIEYKSEDVDTVHLASMPVADISIDAAGNLAKWDKIMALRDEVLKALE